MQTTPMILQPGKRFLFQVEMYRLPKNSLADKQTICKNDDCRIFTVLLPVKFIRTLKLLGKTFPIGKYSHSDCIIEAIVLEEALLLAGELIKGKFDMVVSIMNNKLESAVHSYKLTGCTLKRAEVSQLSRESGDTIIENLFITPGNMEIIG